MQVSKLNCRTRKANGEESSVQDVEVWVKMDNNRKQLHLVIKTFQEEMGREALIYNTVITQLRK